MSRYQKVNRLMTPVAILLAVMLVTNRWAIQTSMAAANDSAPPQVFRFAMVQVLGGVNKEDAKVAIDVYWSRHLKGLFPCFDSHFEILPTVAATAEKIKAGQLHGLSVGIVQYLQLREQFPLRPVFISSRLDRPLESYLLLVRKGVSWQTLQAQPDKHLITEKIVEPNIGRMWLETVLEDRGLPRGQTFFNRIAQRSQPARIVLPVFFGQADACLAAESAYDTLVELNPQIGRHLSILDRSPGFITSIHCTTEKLPGHVVDRFIQHGVQMDDGVDGRQLLLIFHVKKNFVFQPELIENSERIYRRYQSIIK